MVGNFKSISARAVAKKGTFGRPTTYLLKKYVFVYYQAKINEISVAKFTAQFTARTMAKRVITNSII